MKAFAVIFAHLVVMAALVVAIWHWSNGGRFGVIPLVGVSIVYLGMFVRYGCLSH